MKLVKEIADSIHPSIQLTADYPSNNEDTKIPILNLKVWTKSDGENRINVRYEPYRKEVSTKATVLQRTAMSNKQKRSILTQELLTIMNNCSSRLEETTPKRRINEYLSDYNSPATTENSGTIYTTL